MSQEKIAGELGISQTAISNELKRNTGKRGHRPKQATQKAAFRRK